MGGGSGCGDEGGVRGREIFAHIYTCELEVSQECNYSGNDVKIYSPQAVIYKALKDL